MIYNNPNKAGQLADQPAFTDSYRFKMAPIHTRFDDVEWFVWDADVIDEITGKPAAVAQGSFNHCLEYCQKHGERFYTRHPGISAG